MKRNRTGKPDSRKSPCTLTWVKILVVYPALVILVCIPLLSLFAVVRLSGLFGECLGSLQGLFILVGAVISYLTWLVLTGDWGQLVLFLPVLVELLRSVGLL